MSYHNDMKRCVEYIHRHAHDDIAAGDLARMIGYSYHHFCHVFRIYFDVPVGEYIRREKLHRAADAICNYTPVTQAALDCGFETPSGFTRAFKRTYGISPTEYKRRQTTKQEGGIRMEPKYVQKGAIMAVGYKIDPEPGSTDDVVERGAFWQGKDFSSVSKEEYAKLASSNQGDLATWVHPEDEVSDLSYFFGPIVDSFHHVPQGMIPLEIPAAKYAVFTVPVDYQTMSREEYVGAIKNAWKYIFQEWFDRSGQTYDEDKYNFELYLNETMEIYIPVK